MYIASIFVVIVMYSSRKSSSSPLYSVVNSAVHHNIHSTVCVKLAGYFFRTFYFIFHPGSGAILLKYEIRTSSYFVFQNVGSYFVFQNVGQNSERDASAWPGPVAGPVAQLSTAQGMAAPRLGSAGGPPGLLEPPPERLGEASAPGPARLSPAARLGQAWQGAPRSNHDD